MYDDPLFPVDKENVIRNICEQMKVKLVAEEQLLLLVRFVEFAYSNSEEFENHLPLFHLVADIFAIPQEEFDDILAFITGKPSSSLLTISGEDAAIGNHITRKGGTVLFVYSLSGGLTSKSLLTMAQVSFS